MSGFDVIDLSSLPPPQVIEQLDFETILAAMKADMVARVPELAGVLALESEPVVKFLEVIAYRELLIRAHFNDRARALMLAFSTASDLDHLGALLGVARLVITAADPLAVPPVAAVLETDRDFRARIQLSLEGYTSAGPVGAYVFHALSAHPSVSDVHVDSPAPGVVRVVVLAREGDGTPAAEVLEAVEAQLNAEEVRPLCDAVSVLPASIVTYEVEAVLQVLDGPDAGLVQAAAEAAIAEFTASARQIGRPVPLSGIYAALHRPGVLRVDLAAPAAEVAVEVTEAAHCTAVTLTVEVIG